MKHKRDRLIVLDCGNTLKNNAVIAPGGLSDCNMLCKGNSSEYCGAGNRLDVYKQGYLGSGSSVSSVTVSTTVSAMYRQVIHVAQH